MTATVELDSLQKLDVGLHVIIGLGFCSLLHELVEIVDIASMMLTVVEFHSLAADHRFESTNFIWKVLQDCAEGFDCGSFCRCEAALQDRFR